MVFLFFIKCESCDLEFLMETFAMGWVDQKGFFGFFEADGFSPKGDPCGNYHTVNFSMGFCETCGETSYLVENDTNYPLNMDNHVENTDKLNIINVNGLKEEQYDELLDITFPTYKIRCAKCGTKYITGFELLLRLSNREKFRNIKPLQDKTSMMRCPNCKQHRLILKNYLRY